MDSFVRPKATKVGIVKVPHFIVDSSAETVRIDDAGTYQYFGYATIGSAENAAVWKISRYTIANPNALLWADGDSLYNNTWSNRATLSYS